jgi:hypothetical protein
VSLLAMTVDQSPQNHQTNLPAFRQATKNGDHFR